MIKSVTGFYFCMRYQKIVWMDAACEDSWDLEKAMHACYAYITESAK